MFVVVNAALVAVLIVDVVVVDDGGEVGVVDVAVEYISYLLLTPKPFSCDVISLRHVPGRLPHPRDGAGGREGGEEEGAAKREEKREDGEDREKKRRGRIERR